MGRTMDVPVSLLWDGALYWSCLHAMLLFTWPCLLGRCRSLMDC